MMIRVRCKGKPEIFSGLPKKSMGSQESSYGRSIVVEAFADADRGEVWWDSEYEVIPQTGWHLHPPQEIDALAIVRSISMDCNGGIMAHCDWLT